jgi:hypothetical protein
MAARDRRVGRHKLAHRGIKLMKKALAFFLLTLFALSAPAVRGQEATTKIRGATSLPSSCTPSSANVPADAIIVNGVYYICTATNTWTSVRGTEVNNIWTGNNAFGGPAPSIDITAHGARALITAPSTTASCNGTTTVTVTSATGFQKGDGVVVYGCGPSESMTTPSAPTVTPGISNTLTVPDAVLTTLTDRTTYTYKLVSRDKFGGLTVPSSATTITTGLSSLGEQQLTIASATISGSTMTIVMSAPERLQANELIHIVGTTNAATRGWFNISSITNSTTFVVKNMAIYSDAGVSATGGTLTYYTGNQLTWTNSGSNIWESIICASRPTDSGAYHVIGLSYPVSDVAYGSSTTFTDWGATLTSKPALPSYITDSVCTAGSVTHDYLSTTISNISGTAFTLANSASQKADEQTFLFDDAPGIKAAAAAAKTSYGGVLFIPWSNSGSYYFVNSFLDLTAYNNPVLAIHQEGILYLNETFEPTLYWYGFTGGQTRNSSAASTPSIAVNTAWPGVFYSGPFPFTKNLTFNYTGSNQALLMEIDGVREPQGGDLDTLNFSTGASTDYSGIGLLIRPSPFNFKIKNCTFTGGPGNAPSNVDQTWTPMLYLARDTSNGSGSGTVPDWAMSNMQFVARGIYSLGYGGTVGTDQLNEVYNQGAIMPTMVLQNVNGLVGLEFKETAAANDTSDESYLAILGGEAVDLMMEQMQPLSVETGGYPPMITGIAPGSIAGWDNSGSPIGPLVNSQPITGFVNSNLYDRHYYYANDNQDTGKYNFARAIQQFSHPVSSLSSFFIPLGVAILSAPSASSGGTIPDGVHTYCVQPVGWNGGWGLSSCRSVAVRGTNHTLAFSWTSVPGVQGYVISQDGNSCLPRANVYCNGLSTTAGTTTLTYTGGSSPAFNVAKMTAVGDGSQGFNANGLFGSQLLLYSGAYKGVSLPTTLSANRIYTQPDMSGTYALDLKGATSTITGTSLTTTCDSGTASVPGAMIGMPVVVSTTDGTDIGGAFNLRASVTAGGTVTVYVCGTGTPPSKAYNVRVIQ